MTKLTNKWKNKDNKDKDNDNKDTSIQSNENNVFKKRH